MKIICLLTILFLTQLKVYACSPFHPRCEYRPIASKSLEVVKVEFDHNEQKRKCGVFVVSKAGYETMPRYQTNAVVSWFNCDDYGRPINLGEIIKGTVSEACSYSCERCATGRRFSCVEHFEPIFNHL